MAATRRFLFNVGWLTLFAPAGLTLVLVALHLSGAINAWIFPFIPVAVFCLFGGSSCLIVAQLVERPAVQGISVRRAVYRRRLCWALATLIVCLNSPAYLLAYHMTHVRDPGQVGLGVPRPSHTQKPSDRGLSYATRTIPISQSKWLEAWEINVQASNPRGTVILFHGNLGTKSSQLIPPAQSFIDQGFNTLLIDFQGGGGSSGDTVTLGINEAKDVVAAFNYQKEQNIANGQVESPIILYGVSMGTAAILRAISTHIITPDAIILELPFVRLVDAIKSRLSHHKIPTDPTALLMIFWASIQHGVNGFGHNPIGYAKAVDCPTLVIHGAQDKWTSVSDIEALVQTIPDSKQLVVSLDAGHHQLIGMDRQLWDLSISNFLNAF
ncbi:MAG: alpha/beta hydrolase [Leptolyngbya sp. SIO3F4]|nr:alpha/beta hydrolase [Leptolyngbya sp. SIO3F4]